MLSSIRQRDRRKVYARDSEKQDKPFCCQKCLRETILRKGLVKAHHFAHKPPFACEHGKGESDTHRRCKQELLDCLVATQGIEAAEIEKDLGAVIPDVYCRRGSVQVAIEVQISALTMGEIIRRTEEYDTLGVHVLWLPMFSSALDGERYAPRQWEKWLHAVGYGRVYYWLTGLTVASVHFDPYELEVPESQWYSEDGEEMSAGGYGRDSKRWRTPRRGADLDLIADLRPSTRDAWSGGSIQLPNCRILLDGQPRWWT